MDQWIRVLNDLVEDIDSQDPNDSSQPSAKIVQRVMMTCFEI